MCKWGVFYSSVTGNTRQIAEQIAATAGNADILPMEKIPADLSCYDIVALGYWVKRGKPDPRTLRFLPQIKNANVVFFETHGTDPHSEHAITAFARAAYLLGPGCNILGTFDCQGKINPALLEMRKNAAPDDPHGGVKAQERWQRATSHPDEEDLAAASSFVAKMQHKLYLLQK